MELSDGLELYLKAREKHREDRLYKAWVSLYPEFHIGRIPFMTFEDFKKQQDAQVPVIKPTERKSAKQLIAEAEDIKRQIEGR